MSQSRFSRSRESVLYFGAVAVFAVTAATAQVATGIDNSGSYQQEVQACMTGKTQQDQATCLREARNAQADKKRGVLETNTSDVNSNALARCAPLSGDDRTACIARMSSAGQVSGSVAGGGVLREVETVKLPAGTTVDNVTIQQQTAGPVVVVPGNAATQ